MGHPIVEHCCIVVSSSSSHATIHAQVAKAVITVMANDVTQKRKIYGFHARSANKKEKK
jgi:hypothetical protein